MRLFHSTSMFRKLLSASIITTCIPIILLGAVILPIYRGELYGQVKAEYLAAVEQFGGSVNTTLEQMVYYSSIYFGNSDMNRILRKRALPAGYEVREDEKTISDIFTSNTYIFGELRYYTTIVGANGASFTSTVYGNTPSFSDLKREPWYDSFEKGGGRIEWVVNTDGRFSPYPYENSGFVAVRPVLHPYTGEVLGTIIVIPLQRTIEKLLESAMSQFDHFYIADSSGRIFLSSDGGELAFTESLWLEKLQPYEKGYFHTRVGSADSLITFCTAELTGWKIVGTMDVKNLFLPVDTLWFAVLLLFAVFLAVFLVISLIINRRISRPIQQLAQEMGMVSEGDLSIRSSVEEKDEIGRLAHSFSIMTQRLEKLWDDYRIQQNEKRRAEILALQAQIKPHFLYNTLASIRFMLVTRPAEETDRVISALVRLLKGTVNADEERLTVREEMDMLYEYVLIMQARNPGQYQVHFDVPPQVEELSTLRLLLQPLVENAIYHGLSQIDAGGMIWVKAGLDEGMLILSVADNGMGMSREAIAAVMGSAPPAGHVGIRNIHDRIRCHFGPEYGLTIEQGACGGLCVTLRLPAELHVGVREELE